MLDGKIVLDGTPKDVVNRYVGYVLDWERKAQASDGPGAQAALSSTFRHGDGTSRVTDVKLTGRDGEPCRSFYHGDPIRIRVASRFDRDASNPVVGILIRNRIGVDVFGTNTRLEERELGRFETGDLLEVEFELDCLLSRGEYTLTVATQHWDGRSQDWLDEVVDFNVIDTKDVAGVLNLNTRVRHQRTAGVTEGGL